MKKKIKQHNGGVTEIIPVESENRVISYSSVGKTIQIHTLDTLSEISTILAHDKDISKVLYYPYRKIIISASKDKFMKLWSVTTGEFVRQIMQEDEIKDIVLIPESDLLLSATQSGICLWHLPTMKLIQYYYENPIYSIKLLPLRDQEHFIGIIDNTIKVYSTQNKIVIRVRDESSEISNWVLSPNSKYLFYAARNVYSKIWDLEQDKIIKHLVGRTKSDIVHFSNNEEWIYELSSGRIRKTNVENFNKEKEEIIIQGDPLFFSGNFQVCLTKQQQVLFVYDNIHGNEIGYYNADADINCAVLTLHSLVIAGDSEGKLHFLDLENYPAENIYQSHESTFIEHKREFFSVQPIALKIVLGKDKVKKYVESQFPMKKSLIPFSLKNNTVENKRLCAALRYNIKQFPQYIPIQSIRGIASCKGYSIKMLCSILHSQQAANLLCKAKKEKYLTSIFDLEGARKLKEDQIYSELYPIVLALCYNSDINELHQSLKDCHNPFPWTIWAVRMLQNKSQLQKIEFALMQALQITPSYHYATLLLAELYAKNFYYLDKSILIYQQLASETSLPKWFQDKCLKFVSNLS